MKNQARLAQSLRSAVVAVALTCGPAGSVYSAGTAEIEVLPFERCLAAGAPSQIGSARLRAEAWDRTGHSSVSRAVIFWRESGGEVRVILRMTAPEELRGSSILLVENDESEPEAFVYLPEIEKVRRVRGRRLREPLFGTDLGYVDLERLRGLARREAVEQWADGEVEGRPAWVLEARSGRDQVVSWLDKSSCLPLRTEVIDRKGRLAKVIEVTPESLGQADALVPHRLVIKDVLGETETRLDLEPVRLESPLPASFFEPEALANPRRSRRGAAERRTTFQ